MCGVSSFVHGTVELLDAFFQFEREPPVALRKIFSVLGSTATLEVAATIFRTTWTA